jgi:protein TonB
MDTFGLLAECLTDADRESRARARSLRGRSMAIAVAIETALAGALLIWPLMHLGVLGQAPDLLPRPIFFTPHPAPVFGDRATTTSPHLGPVFQTLNFHPAIAAHPSREANGVDAPPGFGPTGDTETGGQFIDLGGSEARANLRPPAHPAEAKLPRVSVGVMDAMLIERVEPEYPPIARAMRLAGTVRLHAIIGTDGSVRQLRVNEGNPILAQAALAAVRQWRYRPTLLGGVPVEVETYITVNFVLQ